MSAYTTIPVNDLGLEAVPSRSVKEFFNGRSIFITGGSGFLGKVLVEKLLRSCSNLDTIYLLVRPKKGNDAHNRLKLITDSALFDRLKQEYPNAISKLQIVAGDVTQKGLGLSDADRRTLEDNVSVVFHSAASVRFDDPLRDAIIMNVRGTLEVVKLASCMKQLKAMVHISTTYCNMDHHVVPECVLPSHDNWRTFLEAAETMDSMTLNILTKKILSFHPNTYTFTKFLAEQVINGYQDKLPLVIVRPSIVVPTLCDPVPGWVDSFNGPVAIHVAIGKGILRVMCLNPEITLHYIQVDMVGKALILSAWQRVFQSSLSEVPVYNATGHSNNVISHAENHEIAMNALRESPIGGAVYWPFIYITKHLRLFYVLFLLMHIPQALLLDTALQLAGKKTMVLKLHRKIFMAILALQPFLQNDCKFLNNHFLDLEKLLQIGEMKDFGYHRSLHVEYTYMKNSINGVIKYLLKEELNVKNNYKYMERLYTIHCVLCTLVVAVLGWMLYIYPLHIIVCTKLVNTIRFVLQV